MDDKEKILLKDTFLKVITLIEPGADRARFFKLFDEFSDQLNTIECSDVNRLDLNKQLSR